MVRLADHGLEVLRRPGDGACFYWSAGTGVGLYDRASFDLLGDGTCVSPMEHESMSSASDLLKQMRADRDACTEWLLLPEHEFLLRTESELWNRG